MLRRLAEALSLIAIIALGSARAQSALTPPRQERLRRPSVNSQEAGRLTLSDSLRVSKTRLVVSGARPALFLSKPRLPVGAPAQRVARVAERAVEQRASPERRAEGPARIAPAPNSTRITQTDTKVPATPPPAGRAAPPGDSATRLTPLINGAVAWARVSYLSGTSVYIDAGTKQGIKVGTSLEVVRGSAVVAELVAEYVSSNRASCRVLRSTQSVAVGDSARYEAGGIAPTVIAAKASGAMSSTDAASARRSKGRPVRGRLGVRYLRSDPGLGSASVLIRPAFDVRLDGHQMNGTPIGLTLDVRAHQDRRATAEKASVTRVYQGAVDLTTNSGTRLVVGRQFSSGLSSIGIFDGVTLDIDRSRWGAGVLGGSQPEATTFGLSSAIREYGAYVQLHNERNAAPVWSTTFGAIGSYAHGEIDREFAYLATTFTSQRLSWYAAQELDVNRGWKSDAEESSVVPTSTFAMLRLGVTQDFHLNVGYDSRRSVRLYRDFLTPEIEFDDSFRKGMWGGASLTALEKIRVSADARRSSGGSAGAAQSYTGTLSVSRLTPMQLGFRTRATTYDGDVTRGSLASGSLEFTPFGALHIEGTSGIRRDRNIADSLSRAPIRWNEVSADAGLGRSIYILLSAYRESGGTRTSQAYVAISYRF